MPSSYNLQKFAALIALLLQLDNCMGQASIGSYGSSSTCRRNEWSNKSMTSIQQNEIVEEDNTEVRKITIQQQWEEGGDRWFEASVVIAADKERHKKWMMRFSFDEPLDGFNIWIAKVVKSDESNKQFIVQDLHDSSYTKGTLVRFLVQGRTSGFIPSFGAVEWCTATGAGTMDNHICDVKVTTALYALNNSLPEAVQGITAHFSWYNDGKNWFEASASIIADRFYDVKWMIRLMFDEPLDVFNVWIGNVVHSSADRKEFIIQDKFNASYLKGVVVTFLIQGGSYGSIPLFGAVEWCAPTERRSFGNFTGFTALTSTSDSHFTTETAVGADTFTKPTSTKVTGQEYDQELLSPLQISIGAVLIGLVAKISGRFFAVRKRRAQAGANRTVNKSPSPRNRPLPQRPNGNNAQGTEEENNLSNTPQQILPSSSQGMESNTSSIEHQTEYSYIADHKKRPSPFKPDERRDEDGYKTSEDLSDAPEQTDKESNTKYINYVYEYDYVDLHESDADYSHSQ